MTKKPQKAVAPAKKPHRATGMPMGRPYNSLKLKLDDAMIMTLKGLGQIMATSKEIAAVLGVTEQTWITFKARNREEVEGALEMGRGMFGASLRRKQIDSAMKGNTGMMIWLGKQYLGQTDKQDINTSGSVEVTVTDARSKVERLISRHVIEHDEDETPRKPN